MSLLNMIPMETYKKLENRAAAVHGWLSPVKKLSRGYSLFPLAVLAHVTYRCNLDCAMCCQHIPEHAAGLPGFPIPGSRSQELPLQRWKEIIDDVEASFPVMPFFHFSGGEPFLYPGLMDLIEYAKGKGFSTSVITNGWTLSAIAEDLVSLGVNRINVSIDGPEAVHDLVRRKMGSFRRAVEGLRAVREAREKAGKKHPRLTINCTVTPQNFAYMNDIVKVRDEARADALTVEHLIFLDHERSLAEGIDVDVLLETLTRLEKEENVTLYPHIPKELWKTFYLGSSKDLGHGCGMLWAGLRIHPSGEVGPCRGQVMATLADRSVSVKKIWNNEIYRACRHEIATMGNVEACGRCEHKLY